MYYEKPTQMCWLVVCKDVSFVVYSNDKLEIVGVNVNWKVESGKFWNCVAIIKYQLIWLYM